MKINSFIDILSNFKENIDILAPYKEPVRLKDKISLLILEFCNLQKSNGYYSERSKPDAYQYKRSKT